jgi:hypothetical protein
MHLNFEYIYKCCMNIFYDKGYGRENCEKLSGYIWIVKQSESVALSSCTEMNL